MCVQWEPYRLIEEPYSKAYQLGQRSWAPNGTSARDAASAGSLPHIPTEGPGSGLAAGRFFKLTLSLLGDFMTDFMTLFIETMADTERKQSQQQSEINTKLGIDCYAQNIGCQFMCQPYTHTATITQHDTERLCNGPTGFQFSDSLNKVWNYESLKNAYS